MPDAAIAAPCGKKPMLEKESPGCAPPNAASDSGIVSVPCWAIQYPDCRLTPGSRLTMADAELANLPAEDHTAATDRRLLVADALRALSPLHRELLNETILRDRTVNQAAEVLGVPVGTVKSRVYYALRALQVVLAERGVPP